MPPVTAAAPRHGRAVPALVPPGAVAMIAVAVLLFVARPLDRGGDTPPSAQARPPKAVPAPRMITLPSTDLSAPSDVNEPAASALFHPRPRRGQDVVASPATSPIDSSALRRRLAVVRQALAEPVSEPRPRIATPPGPAAAAPAPAVRTPGPPLTPLGPRSVLPARYRVPAPAALARDVAPPPARLAADATPAVPAADVSVQAP